MKTPAVTTTGTFEWAIDFGTNRETLNAEVEELAEAIRAFAESSESLRLVAFELEPVTNQHLLESMYRADLGEDN